jgi:hypothetical protein
LEKRPKRFPNGTEFMKPVKRKRTAGQYLRSQTEAQWWLGCEKGSGQ